MPSITNTSYSEWRNSSDGKNVLHDMALATLDWADVSTETSRLQQAALSDGTEFIKFLNKLTEDLRQFRPSTKGTGSEVADPATPGKLGTTAAESQALIARLQSAGVDILQSDITKPSSGPWQVKQAVFGKWLASLQGISENKSSDTQKIQADLSATMQRLNAANQQASNIFKTKGTVESVPGSNIRA